MNIGEVIIIISFILLVGFIIFGLTLERLTHRRRKKRVMKNGWRTNER